MSLNLINEVNDLRRNPAKYIEKLQKSKDFFKPGTNIWKHPDNKATLKTEKGPAAYDEAISFLKNKSSPKGELPHPKV